MSVNVQGVEAKDLRQDFLNQTATKTYIGDVDGSPEVFAELPDDWADAEDIDAEADAVLDLRNVGTLVLKVHYKKGAGTGGRLRAMFGEKDDRAECRVQQTIEDHETAGLIKHEVKEHELLNDIVYFIEIPRLSRYCKIQVMSTGTPDETDLIAVSYFGMTGRG